MHVIINTILHLQTRQYSKEKYAINSEDSKRNERPSETNIKIKITRDRIDNLHEN